MRKCEIKSIHPRANISGLRSGLLTVLGRSGGKTKGRKLLWICECDCGNIVARTKDILMSKSIGCGLHIKHWSYNLWCGIKRRCYNKNEESYHRYGGRGIIMHAEWVNTAWRFAQYLDENLGPKPSPRHSIDRIENNENYEPGNLQWSLPVPQMYNSRVVSPVAMINDKKNTKRMRFKSIDHASKWSGAKSSNISAVCRGLRKRAAGYQWEYCK